MEKIILTDCDGVLLDWEWAFRVWMIEHGYQFKPEGKMEYQLHHHYRDTTKEDIKKLVRIFNESAAIGFLPALRDSTYYVKRLYEEHQYRFRVITSLSLDKNAAKLREMNLHKVFGDAIESVICLDTGADKDDALAKYKDSGYFWVEDKPENCLAGAKQGLKPLLMEHGFNMHDKDFPLMKNWKEIYNYVNENLV